MPSTTTTQLGCSCGRVQLELRDTPILAAECHCNSCRTAGERMLRLPGAPPVQEGNGGTRFVLYRKDRVQFGSGTEVLREFRLTPQAKTRRVVASCCHTPLFLEFQSGHWLSLYASLWPSGTAPQVTERTMTSDLADPSQLPNDVPNSKQQSFTFFRKLLGAWIAMGFRVPKVSVAGTLEL